MNVKFNSLAAGVLLFMVGCAGPKTLQEAGEVLPAASLKPYGRFTINKDHNLELISSAVHFGFSFQGKQCRIFTSLHDTGSHNYLQYEMDGKYIKRVKIPASPGNSVLLTSEKAGTHIVWIYKATEAHTGAIVIEKVTGKNVKSIESPAAPSIEFIGNSITCGAASDASEIACGTGQYQDQHNAYYAYGPRVARAIGLNFVVSAVSGIGAYRNWNSDGPTMPQVYEKVDFQDKTTELWDFKRYAPKIVSIALGTNDFSSGDGKKKRLPFDSSAFVTSYIQFVQLVKSKYPGSRIALLSSAMLNGTARITLQNCLQAVKQKTDSIFSNDKPVALFFFEPMTAHGCGGHPDVADHALLADQLVPFFKKLLQ